MGLITCMGVHKCVGVDMYGVIQSLFFCVRIYILVLFLGLPFNNYYYFVCWDSHKKKISIDNTTSESCYQEGKKAFRSLSQNLIHQHEKDQTAAKNNNRMVCNPFIQLNTGTDTQGMHTAITFLTISLPTLNCCI